MIADCTAACARRSAHDADALSGFLLAGPSRTPNGQYSGHPFRPEQRCWSGAASRSHTPVVAGPLWSDGIDWYEHPQLGGAGGGLVSMATGAVAGQ